MWHAGQPRGAGSRSVGWGVCGGALKWLRFGPRKLPARRNAGPQRSRRTKPFWARRGRNQAPDARKRETGRAGCSLDCDAFGLLATSSVMAQTPGAEAPACAHPGRGTRQSGLRALRRGPEGEAGGAGARQGPAGWPGLAAGGEDPWTPALRWLTYSSREYQDLLRRLSEGGQRGAGAAAPRPMRPGPSHGPGPAVASRKAEPAPPDGGGWLTLRVNASRP